MQWTRLAGILAVLSVVVGALGALVSFVTTDLFTGSFAIAAILTLAIVVVSVVAMIARGRRSGQWVSNPSSYW